jgi:hypothetical protein
MCVDLRPNGGPKAPLTCTFSVELPGIEPVSWCWSLAQIGAEKRNDADCNSPESTSMNIKCADNVPAKSFNRPPANSA